MHMTPDCDLVTLTWDGAPAAPYIVQIARDVLFTTGVCYLTCGAYATIPITAGLHYQARVTRADNTAWSDRLEIA
jgi:hypothetical protein